MRPAGEFIPFLALAAAAHLGAFAFVAQGGVSSGGDGGEQQLTLQGGDPGIVALLAAWERAPEAPQIPAVADDLSAFQDALPQPPRSSESATIPPLQALPPPEAVVEPPLNTAPPDRPLALPDGPMVVSTPPAMADELPPMPTAPEQPHATILPENPGPEASQADRMPDSTPPPPLELASAPERSPVPPARPAPRDDAQIIRAAPAQASAPAAPSQRAAGAGAQGRDGQGSQAETSRTQADTGGLVAQWGGAIRSAVLRQQRHPAGTRAGGTVHLRLDVHSDGRLLAVALRESSGHAALDQAAMDAVRRARLPAAPQGLNGAYQFNLPVRFRG